MSTEENVLRRLYAVASEIETAIEHINRNKIHLNKRLDSHPFLAWSAINRARKDLDAIHEDYHLEFNQDDMSYSIIEQLML